MVILLALVTVFGETGTTETTLIFGTSPSWGLLIIINCGFARTFTSLLFWTAFTNAPKLKNSLPPILIVLPFNTPIVELSAPIAAVPPDVASPVKAPPVGNPPVIILLLLVAPAAFQLIPKSKLFESETSITSAST